MAADILQQKQGAHALVAVDGIAQGMSADPSCRGGGGTDASAGVSIFPALVCLSSGLNPRLTCRSPAVTASGKSPMRIWLPARVLSFSL
jgi:hypothetical protein